MANRTSLATGPTRTHLTWQQKARCSIPPRVNRWTCRAAPCPMRRPPLPAARRARWISHTPDAVALLFEQNTWFHWVPTAGQKWPEDMPPSWNGVSVGKWNGDTLVVETAGFNGYTRLDTAGHPHSKQLRLTNTFRRIDARTIEHTVTVHDPKTYTRDWMNVRTWRLKPASDVVMEYSCEENNHGNLFSGAIKPWKAPENDDED